MQISRTAYRYEPDLSKDDPVIDALTELAARFPRWGFGKMFPYLRRQGKPWNHKRVYRVYCKLKLNMRRKGKKRLPVREPDALVVPELVNQCWSIDFMSDSLWDGRKYRTFNVVDDHSREVLAIEIDINLPAQRVIRTLDRIALNRGYPVKLRMDNGPAFTSFRLACWAEEQGVELDYIRPGKPMQNAYIERFNRTYREEVLDMYIFSRLSEVRQRTETWIQEYNYQRPHESLDDVPPGEYAYASGNL
jgi:putative transposase